MSAPRILLVIQRFRPTFTGQGIQIEAMARELTARGATIEILTRALGDAPPVESGPVTIRRFPMTPSRNPLRLWWGHRELLRYLHDARSRFDILHIQGAPPGLPLLMGAAREAGYPTVITTTLLDSDDPLTLRRLGRLARWRFRAYSRADRFIALSPALADTFAGTGIDPDRVHTIQIGVPIDRFHPADDAEAEAAALGWTRGAPRAIFVGAVLHRKGVDVLLDAWERVLAELPEAQLYIVGPHDFSRDPDPRLDAFVEVCRRRIAAPPLQGHVTLVGPSTDIDRLMRAAHLFVFPSRMEGFGIVIAEAMASGVPPVVARIKRCTDEIVRDGETGFVVEQEDAAALAARVVTLLRDGALRERFAAAARADAERRYAFSVVAEAHLALYRRLLAGEGGAR